MKIRIRIIPQTEIFINALPEDTILKLKQLVMESQGIPTELQKLIFSGKMLSDTQTVESLGIKETDFMVLLATKAKPAPVVAASSAPPTNIPSTISNNPTIIIPSAKTTPVSAPKINVEPNNSVVQNSENVVSCEIPSSQTDISNSFVTGSVYDSAVAGMMEMGYTKVQTERAMRAAFNNPDRAAEYLMNGLPSDLNQVEPPPSNVNPIVDPIPTTIRAPASTTIPQPVTSPTTTTNGAQNLFHLAQQQQQQQNRQNRGIGGALEPNEISQELMNMVSHPQFEQLRLLVQSNPQMLQPLLQQMSATNPQLYEILSSSPDLLLQILTSDGVGASDYEPASGEQEQFSVQLTEEEAEAIDRLVALGFERPHALEAYLACDKNEEHAANYLCDNQFN